MSLCLQDAGCRMPDVGCRMQDVGYRKGDAGCKIWDVGIGRWTQPAARHAPAPQHAAQCRRKQFSIVEIALT